MRNSRVNVDGRNGSESTTLQAKGLGKSSVGGGGANG